MAENETETGFEKVANLLIQQFTATDTVIDAEGNESEAYRISDEILSGYLAQGLDADLIDIDAMAQRLTELVTPEEVAEMIERAWEKADYEGFSQPVPEDPAPREVHFKVGVSTGAAYVENEGSITIEQAEGTLTAGAVHSDRGDVTLVAEKGGIEGNGDDRIDVIAKNINLTAQDGVGANTALVTEQRDNRLTLIANVTKPVGEEDVEIKPIGADGQPTDEASKDLNPKDLWALETVIRYDWARVEYPADAMQLNVIAGGDVNIVEQTGDMGIGNVTVTDGDVSLATPGSMVDTRTESQKANENIFVTGGDVDLKAETGAIGSETERIETNVNSDNSGNGGTITATAKEDISIADTGDLNLVAENKDGANDTDAQVNASASGDLNLRNVDGDLIVGPIEAAGDATITAAGSIIEGDRYERDAQVSAESIDMSAVDGDIGTEDDPFEVDTNAENGGTLSADGNYINITEIDGDLILKDVDSKSDATLTAPGSILDGNPDTADDAAQAQKDANQAQAEADKKDAEAYIQSEEADKSKTDLDKAEAAKDAAYDRTAAGIQDAITEANDQLAQLDPNAEDYDAQREALEKHIADLDKLLDRAQTNSDALEEAYRKAEEAYGEALENYNSEKAEADAAQAVADAAQAEADRLQGIADAARETAANQDASVSTGNDLILNAGESIGEEGDGLNVQVGGKVDANAGSAEDADDASVNLNGKDGLTVEGIKVPGSITITTIDGDIKDDDGVLEGEKIDASALGGDVGSEENPLTVKVDRVDAQGDNVYIENLQNTTVGNITAKDELELDSAGNVTGSDDNDTNINAEDATINAGGNIGSDENPLKTDVDAFHGNAGDIHIDNQSKDMEISDVEANKLDVETDGNVTGDNITVHDIIINAGGYVGRPDDPFEFWADGFVSIRGGLGAWWINHFRAESRADFAVSYVSMLVLRFDLEIDGTAYSLYALIGVTADGRLALIGFFLCEDAADEAFWTEVFDILRTRMNIQAIGLVIHDGEAAIDEVLKTAYADSTLIDVSEREEDVSWREEMIETIATLTAEPEALLDEIEKFQAATNEQLSVSFETQTLLVEALNSFAKAYTAESEAWIDFLG